MQIHNFLTDLLASTRLLIDDYLFPHMPGLIKSYEFNLGNRTFQLGYEPTSAYALPAVIVNIQDDAINFGGRRSDLIQQNNLPNINKIPVLYNDTNKIAVYVHEEQTMVPFSISINCESQLQAKELGYQIKKTLPLYKNINIFEFTTFLEIDNTMLFDILKCDILLDQIENLYTKINHNTGNIEYCFSLNHKPLIRLDSVTTSIGDSSQSTFQTQLEVTYIIPFPQFLTTDEFNTIDSINFSFNLSNWPIVMIPFERPYLGDISSQKVDRTLIIDSEESTYPSGIIISKTETQAFITISFDTRDFVIDNTKYSYRFSKCVKGLKNFNVLEPTYYYESDNKLVFIMTLAEYLPYTPSATSPLLIDFYYDL